MSTKLYVSESEHEVYTEIGYEKQRRVDGFFTAPGEGRTEVDPVCLPGSPDSGRICVVTASGSSFYMNDKGVCVENSYMVGPVCAKNVQSALVSLFGKVKRDLTLESCLLYEIDKDYSETEPEDIFAEKLIGELFKKVAAGNGRLDAESMSRDYVAELTEFDEQNPAYTTKLNSKELKSVADYLMKTAEKTALESAPKNAKVASDPGAYEALKTKLAQTFTTAEIKKLEPMTRGEEVPAGLGSKALALAPKFKAKVSFFAKLFGKG